MNFQEFTLGRIEQTAKRITSFRKLQVGWHYGEGQPPTSESIERALKLNLEASLAGFRKTNAFPGVDGEIRVTAYHGPIYVELTVEVDGSITYGYERNDSEVAYEEGIAFQDAIERIKSFRGLILIWASSGSSINSSTIPTNDVSKVLPSNPLATAAAYQSLTRTASCELARASVNTSKDTTETYLEHLFSSGSYDPKTSLRSASSSSKQAKWETLAITT